jgi:type IV secretory pathway VirB2 component (pilin)
MSNEHTKRLGTIVGGIIVAFVAPMVVLGIVGLGYVLFVYLNQGLTWSAAVEQSTTVLIAYQSYLSLLTIIPLVVGLAGVLKATRRRHND